MTGIAAGGAAERAAAVARVPAERRVTTRQAAVVAAVVAFAAGVLAMGTLPVGTMQDDGMYVVLAKALAGGEGYRFINLPGAPPGTHFPPGYPLFLAALWHLAPGFPENVALFKLANAALVGAAAAGVVLLGRRVLGLPVPAALAAAVVGAVSIPMLTVSAVVMSEALFLALLCPAILLAERAATDGGARRTAGAAALCAAVTLVRTIGIASGVALLVALAWRRRWRDAAIAAAVMAVLLVPWQLWSGANAAVLPPALAGKYGPYAGWLADGYRAGGVDFALQLAARNLADGAAATVNFLAVSGGAAWRLAAGLAVALLLAVGGWAAVRRGPVLVLALLGYGAIVVVWPFEPHRFVWAVWPLGILVLAAAADAGRAMPARPRAAVLAAAALLLAGHGAALARGVADRAWERVPRAGAARAAPLADWVGRNTAPGDVVVSDDELVVYLYTGRRAVPNGSFTALDRVRAGAPDEVRGTLGAIVDAFAPRYVLAVYVPPIEAALAMTRGPAPRLRLATALSQGAVFEVVR